MFYIRSEIPIRGGLRAAVCVFGPTFLIADPDVPQAAALPQMRPKPGPGAARQPIVVETVMTEAARRADAEPCPRPDNDGTAGAVTLAAGRHGCSLDPATRVLTADLRWISIADIRPGQELVACDEDPHPRPGRRNGCRKLRTAVVEAVRRSRAPAWRIRLDDGRSVVCAAGHGWLARLRPGDLVRTVALPWGARDAEDGWFGGIVDGEGSFGCARPGPRLIAYQCDGPVLVRMLGHCIARRYAYFTSSDEGARHKKFGQRPVHAIHICGIASLFHVMGLSRPVRFIGTRWWEGRGMPHNGWRTITAIEPEGEVDFVEIRTSTRTCIAEGLVSHGAMQDAAGPVSSPAVDRATVHAAARTRERQRRERHADHVDED